MEPFVAIGVSIGRIQTSDPGRSMESRGCQQEPAEPPERRGIDQQGGAAPSAPGSHRVDALPAVQELRLPTQLFVDPMVEPQRGERMALGHAREGDQTVPLRMLPEELEVETAGDVGRARPVEEIVDRPVRTVAVSRAARLAHPAVVDQQRVARMGEPGGHFLDEGDRTLREDGFLSVSQRDVIARRWVGEMFDESIVVVTSAQSKWANRAEIDLADLSNEPWILAPSPNMARELVENAFRRKGLEPPQPRATGLQPAELAGAQRPHEGARVGFEPTISSS